MMRQAAQACRAITSQASRAFSKAASEGPSYTYLPPGCSLREPVYISLSDPVYFYDMPPSKLSESKQQAIQAAAEDAKQKAQQQASGGLKAAFESATGSKGKAEELAPAYRMVDDLSQQPYIVSLGHSMREPKYVSMTDPKYAINSGPTAGTKSPCSSK